MTLNPKPLVAIASALACGTVSYHVNRTGYAPAPAEVLPASLTVPNGPADLPHSSLTSGVEAPARDPEPSHAGDPAGREEEAAAIPPRRSRRAPLSPRLASTERRFRWEPPARFEPVRVTPPPQPVPGIPVAEPLSVQPLAAQPGPAPEAKGTTTPTASAPERPKPAGACRTCGGKVEVLVEVAGEYYRYCSKHYGDATAERRKRSEPAPRPPAREDPPVPRPAPPSAPVAEPVKPPAEPPASSPPQAPAGEPAAAGTRRPRKAPQEETPSAQCRGRTKAGVQCRRKTRDPSGFCYQHRGQ